jgi:hypothetical protein
MSVIVGPRRYGNILAARLKQRPAAGILPQAALVCLRVGTKPVDRTLTRRWRPTGLVVFLGLLEPGQAPRRGHTVGRDAPGSMQLSLVDYSSMTKPQTDVPYSLTVWFAASKPAGGEAA